MNVIEKQDHDDWQEICHINDITPNTGIAARIDDLQIAIFRVGAENRVYALSHYDPFSQANVMARGILGDMQGERVVASPIYKQHFSLITGRCLEDNTQKLQVYPSKIEDGVVWISPIPQKTYTPSNGQNAEKLKLVLVGNGLAGMRCLEDLLDMAPERYDISVIGEEPYGNYNRIMLSPVLSGEKKLDDIMLNPLEWYAQKNINLVINDPAIRIDRARKQVHTKLGKILDYDRLILATGAKPFVPNIVGNDLQGVLSFRNIHDVETMLDYSKVKKNAVVIGGGLLGLEAAYGLKQRGMNVTVLHLSSHIMDRQLDAAASEMLQNAIEAKGIRIVTGAKTEEILGKNGQVSAVRLKNGDIIATDIVVFATGIQPNKTLAEQAGLRCQRGIYVNDTMQTYDPSIYAVGECIEHRGQTFGLVEPLWGQAFICATHLAEHGRLTFKAPIVPTQLKVSGCDVFSAGNIQPEGEFEDIIVRDQQRQCYKRLIIQNNKMIGAVLFGDIEDGAWYAELIADKTPIQGFKNKLLFGREFNLKYFNQAS